MNNQLYIYALIFLGLILIMSNLDKILGLFPKENLSGYTLKPAILSRAEMAFYKAFLAYKKDDNPVFAKVRLADVFCPAGKGRAYMSDFNKISANHVDFLVCDKNTARPLYAIELDNKSRISEKTVMREDFADRLFSEAGLRLIHVQSENEYTDDYLEVLFGGGGNI